MSEIIQQLVKAFQYDVLEAYEADTVDEAYANIDEWFKDNRREHERHSKQFVQSMEESMEELVDQLQPEQLMEILHTEDAWNSFLWSPLSMFPKAKTQEDWLRAYVMELAFDASGGEE